MTDKDIHPIAAILLIIGSGLPELLYGLFFESVPGYVYLIKLLILLAVISTGYAMKKPIVMRLAYILLAMNIAFLASDFIQHMLENYLLKDNAPAAFHPLVMARLAAGFMMAVGSLFIFSSKKEAFLFQGNKARKVGNWKGEVQSSGKGWDEIVRSIGFASFVLILMHYFLNPGVRGTILGSLLMILPMSFFYALGSTLLLLSPIAGVMRDLYGHPLAEFLSGLFFAFTAATVSPYPFLTLPIFWFWGFLMQKSNYETGGMMSSVWLNFYFTLTLSVWMIR